MLEAKRKKMSTLMENVLCVTIVIRLNDGKNKILLKCMAIVWNAQPKTQHGEKKWPINYLLIIAGTKWLPILFSDCHIIMALPLHHCLKWCMSFRHFQLLCSWVLLHSQCKNTACNGKDEKKTVISTTRVTIKTKTEWLRK